MGGKTAIAAGLVLGALAGAALLGGVVLLAPDTGASGETQPTPVATASPVPSSAPSPPASPQASASPGPPASPGPSASPGTSDPPGTSPSVAASSSTGLFGVGQPAPSLVVPQLGGGTIDLAALHGKPVWVNFMATWCLPCRDELPVMAGFAVRYQDQGLVVLAIDVREDAPAVQAFMQTVGVTLPTGLDGTGNAQSAWGALALPVHFWVDKDGVVRDGALGGIGPDIMAKGLQAILPGITVTP
jgi:cytochrome c biogenesis protein CcmG, thiol:disulfide interchange protein DsbE